MEVLRTLHAAWSCNGTSSLDVFVFRAQELYQYAADPTALILLAMYM